MLHVASNLYAVNLSTGLLRSVGWELFKEEISVKLLELSQELMKDGRMQYHGAFKIYAGISPNPWCFFTYTIIYMYMNYMGSLIFSKYSVCIRDTHYIY